MNPYSAEALANAMSMCAMIYGPTLKPYNPDQIASYQKQMQVVFVPSLVHDLKRVAGVSTIHALYSEPEAAARVSVVDRAYLLAFHATVAAALNLKRFGGGCEYRNQADTAVQLSQDPALLAKIDHQYFHQHSGLAQQDCSAPEQITSECEDYMGYSTNYVVLPPGAITTHFEVGCAPPMDEMLTKACEQHLAVLRECLKPFNLRSTKESIAMCDPSGTFSAYLALLEVA